VCVCVCVCVCVGVAQYTACIVKRSIIPCVADVEMEENFKEFPIALCACLMVDGHILFQYAGVSLYCDICIQ